MSCLIKSCISVVKVVGGCILAKESWMKFRFYTMDITWYCSGKCWSICTLVFFWNIKNIYPFVWFVCLPSKVQEPRSSTVEFWNHIFNQLKILCNVVFHAYWMYWIKIPEFACSHPLPSWGQDCNCCSSSEVSHKYCNYRFSQKEKNG